MRMLECYRCGQDMQGGSIRDFTGKSRHLGYCPTPPEPVVEATPTTPVRIVHRLRAFCRLDLDHAKCAGGTRTEDRVIQVCACTCHTATT